MSQELILPEPDDNCEIPFQIDNDVRRNLFEMASTLPCDNPNEVLGTRLIDIANEWDIQGQKFPTLENVQQFLKTYQNQDLPQNNTPILNITFSQDQNQILEILQKQIDEINEK